MEGRVGERKEEGLAVKREEGGGAWADVDVGTEKVVDGEDGEDGEGEWKGKLATPGLWDEGFEELEGRGGMGYGRNTSMEPDPQSQSHPHLPQLSAITNTSPSPLLSHSPTLNLYHLAPPPIPFNTPPILPFDREDIAMRQSSPTKVYIQSWQILGRWSKRNERTT